jgi:hypothetical protein
MAILTINGAAMPSPSGLEIAYKSIGKAETSASGETVMDRIALKRTITANFSYLTQEGAKALSQAVMQNANFFDLTFYDPMTGTELTGIFRATECRLSPYRYAEGVPVGHREGKITMEER